MKTNREVLRLWPQIWIFSEHTSSGQSATRASSREAWLASLDTLEKCYSKNLCDQG